MDLLQHLGIAFSLMLILEGVLPFMYPQRWRNMVTKLSEIDNRQLRIAGFGSMLVGLLMLSMLT
ncbi:DUF2065 domain-containing protein [Endozoicomonas arenosclerae]|uniref:DUF2065 domain-containing protein n=1 Tax=Endozoicomonas arenosclerae TaxID=1633495 RepID=UPI0007816EC8|nr:DUF2065 domain-containing protein [Endozoicomonas arenosclerae]